MKYTVLREHLGDRDYRRGDEREADPSSVAHLVALGVLAETSPAPDIETAAAIAAPESKRQRRK